MTWIASALLSAVIGTSVGAATALTPLVPAECELKRSVVFGGLDWDSNAFHVAVASYILNKAYGCKTETIPGSTIPMLAGIGHGDVDILMEVWRDQSTEAWAKLEAAGKVFDIGTNFADARQGFFVPRYLVEKIDGHEPLAKGLKSVSDLPRFRTLFTDPEEPKKGRFYNCILGWTCEIVNTKKLKVYGLLEHFVNFRSGTGAALAAAIASAYAKRVPFVSYYWGPSWVLGAFDLVQLEEPPYERTAWVEFNNSPDPKATTAYPTVEVGIAVSKKFKDTAPGLVSFLSNYHTSSSLINTALSEIHHNVNAKMESIAVKFLRENQDVWRQWLPEERFRRVADALSFEK